MRTTCGDGASGEIGDGEIEFRPMSASQRVAPHLEDELLVLRGGTSCRSGDVKAVWSAVMEDLARSKSRTQTSAARRIREEWSTFEGLNFTIS